MFSGLSNSYSQTACVDLGSQGQENTTQASESLTLFGLAVSRLQQHPHWQIGTRGTVGFVFNALCDSLAKQKQLG